MAHLKTLSWSSNCFKGLSIVRCAYLIVYLVASIRIQSIQKDRNERRLKIVFESRKIDTELVKRNWQNSIRLKRFLGISFDFAREKYFASIAFF